MKAKLIYALAAATALTSLQPAQAADKEKYLIGGLLGGWILNEVFDSPVRVRHHRPVEVYTHGAPCPPVVVERHGYHPRPPAGRYEVRQVKDWIPGRYEYVRGCYGRTERRWIPGHYTYRTEKFWVPYGRHDSRGRDHGRDYDHGRSSRR